MSDKKGKDQGLGVAPSGYIHPDNAQRLLNGETVAFRKKPYSHDGGGIPVFVGQPPVSAEPVLRIGTDRNGELAIFTPRFNSVIARFTPCGKSGMKEGLLYAAPVVAQAQPEPDWRLIKKGDQRIINGQVMTCTDPEIGRWQGSGPQQPVSGADVLDERAAFEWWASDEGENPRAVERSGHGYELAQIQTYWQAWQARAAWKGITNG